MPQPESESYFRGFGLSDKVVKILIDNEVNTVNFKKLREYDIRDMFPLVGERVDVREAVEKANRTQGMQISVWIAKGGDSLMLDVEPSDTIENIKAMIHAKMDIPLDHQTLIFAGERLFDGQTLFDYDIRPGATVELWEPPHHRSQGPSLRR